MQSASPNIAVENTPETREPILSEVWALWCHPWPLSRAVGWTLAALLAAYCAALVYLGALHTNLFGHDSFIVLDSGWRVLQGQLPHVDFHTAQGPVFSIYSAFVMLAGRANLGFGFGFARALATAALTIWCFLLLRNRIIPAATIVLCVLVALMAGAPFALTSSPFTQSMAMFYNRFGYALLALVLLDGFQPRPPSFVGGFSSGIAIGLLLFLKINFFGASLGFLALSMALRRPRLDRLAGLVTGSVLLAAPIIIWLRFDIAAMANDLRALAVARASVSFPLHRLLRTLNDSVLPIILLVSVGVIVTLLRWEKNSASVYRLSPVVLSLATAVAEIAVGIANQQNAVFFLMGIASVLLMALLADVPDVGPSQTRSFLGAVLILGLSLDAWGPLRPARLCQRPAT